MSQLWQKAQVYEAHAHGDCRDNSGEVLKQNVYAKLMGFPELVDNTFDFSDKSIVDIGGGPESILLRTKAKSKLVVEPCAYPEHIWNRYEVSNIPVVHESGETVQLTRMFDEAWMYNVLQHVDHPDILIQNILPQCRKFRICEWINIPMDEGHIHTLTEENMNAWCKCKGVVTHIHQHPSIGTLWSAVLESD